MIKFCSILLMSLGFVATSARAENPIDFSTSDNLKAVYDAGFRPWRNGMSSCHLDHVKVTVILPENAQFSLPAQMAGFTVLAGDQLSGADFYSEVTSTDEAVARTSEICVALGISTAGLDQAVPSFADRFSKPSYWAGRGKKGGISIQVTLDILPFFDHLEAKVYVFLQWKREGVPMKFLTSPVQPPPGYENASMAPPGVNPNQQGFPKHDLDYYKNLIDQKKAEEANPSTSVVPSPAAPQQPTNETGDPFGTYAIIALSLALISSLWYFLRPRK